MKLRNVLFILIAMIIFLAKMESVYAIDIQEYSASRVDSNILKTVKVAATDDSDVDPESDMEDENDDGEDDPDLYDSGNEGNGREDDENQDDENQENDDSGNDSNANSDNERSTSRASSNSRNNTVQNQNIVNIEDEKNATQDIPQTGISQSIIIALILIFSINSVIIFKKIKKYNV